MINITHGKYEAVIGLEVHAQLNTRSKLFSGDANAFGSRQNTHVSPITLGHPGTLPRMNKFVDPKFLSRIILPEKIISILIYQRVIKYPNIPLQSV